MLITGDVSDVYIGMLAFVTFVSYAAEKSHEYRVGKLLSSASNITVLIGILSSLPFGDSHYVRTCLTDACLDELIYTHRTRFHIPLY